MRQRSQTSVSLIQPRRIVATPQDPNQTACHRPVNVAKPFALIPLPSSHRPRPQAAKAPTAAADIHTPESPPSTPVASPHRLIPTRQLPRAPARRHRPSYRIPTTLPPSHETTVALRSTDGSSMSGARSSVKKGD